MTALLAGSVAVAAWVSWGVVGVVCGRFIMNTKQPAKLCLLSSQVFVHSQGSVRQLSVYSFRFSLV